MTPLCIAKYLAPLSVAFGLAAQEIPKDTEVQTTASGLKYSILRAGDGSARPGETDSVKVHYTGWLTDGKKFDSSRDRGKPAVFPLNGVIRGWTEGLQLMSPGARFKFTIPWSLGYGERGSGGSIPPKADLIFDVELLGIEPKVPDYDEAKVEKTESGIRYQYLIKSEGAKVGDDEIAQFSYERFQESGKYMEGTWKSEQKLDGGVMERLGIQEITKALNVGDKIRVSIPAGIGVLRTPEEWIIELSGVKKTIPVPAFSLPEEDQFEKTSSGLMYKVVKSGSGEGANPRLGQNVTVHYAGWLTDGTLFDSSYGRGDTATFSLGRVIQGWNEGLALMKAGDTYLFKIPGDLAYGQRGSPPKIGPNATLVFHVELIKVGD